MKKIYCCLLFLFSFNICIAQEVPVTTQQQLEELANATESEIQDDQYLQQLDYLKKHPVNINSAETDELQLIYFLTGLQIENLVRYRRIFGNFISLYELQAIPSWDLVTIQKALPYLSAKIDMNIKENFLLRFRGEQNLMFRISRVIEKSKAYDTSQQNHYAGDRNHLTLRYRYQYKNLFYFGLTADKDPGEQFFKGAQSKGFDFYSYHFFVRDMGNIKALAIGDYAVNLGQGLIQWQSAGFGKSADIISIKRQSPVLVPYRSGGEFYFNRGIGVTLKKKDFEASFFASRKKIDGNIETDSSTRFTSMQTSGYHRTPAEIEDRDRILLTSIGGNLNYYKAPLKIGINATGHRFNIPFQKPGEPYNLYALNGTQIWNASVDYSYTFRNMHFFGEAAIDKKLHRAFVNAVLISADPKVDLSVLYRNIQKEYVSLFGNAITENTSPSNEKGLYAGISVKPHPFWHFNAYADLYHFPWLKFRVNAPVHGYDYLVQLNYQYGKKFSMYLRYRNKNKPVNKIGGLIQSPDDQQRQSLRFHISGKLNSDLSLNSRCEVIWLNRNKMDSEEGFLGFAEASWKVFSKLSVDLRVQYFETSGYNSRIYAYETDLLYSFSIPAFSEKGFRYYFNFAINYDQHLSFWGKWSQTIFASKSRKDTELNEIQGNKNSEFKLQVRYIF